MFFVCVCVCVITRGQQLDFLCFSGFLRQWQFSLSIGHNQVSAVCPRE